eukprot:s779_g10.t1
MDGWVSAEPHRVVQAELPLVACQSASQSEAASSGHVEGVRKKGGRPRKSWQKHSSFDMLEREGLREAARRWLQEQKVLHKPLVSSSKDRALAVLAACDRCKDCSLQYCFALENGQGNVVCVQQTGECGGEKNLKRIKLFHAKAYATSSSPSNALSKMQDDGIGAAERPSAQQLKNVRPAQKKAKKLDYSVDCLGALRKFVQQPPDGVSIYTDQTTISEEQVRIAFECPAMDAFLDGCQLSSFLMDFTFQTNVDNLLLGACGPAGLRMEKSGPSLRFVPMIYLLAEAEDFEAHRLLLDLFLAKADRHGLSMTDAFLDCKCFAGAAAAFAKSDREVYLHRCLQHCKTNIRMEASRRDSKTGKPRLANAELLGPIIDWTEFSAWLPSDLEFSVFWTSILTRMSSQQLV